MFFSLFLKITTSLSIKAAETIGEERSVVNTKSAKINIVKTITVKTANTNVARKNRAGAVS